MTSEGPAERARARAVAYAMKDLDLAKTPAERQALILERTVERLELVDGFEPRTDEFVLEATRRLYEAGLSEEVIGAWCRTQGFAVERNWLS